MQKEQIIKNIVSIVGQEAIENRTLRELGYDSVDTLDFVVSMENRFDVKMPERNYADMTPTEIADIVWEENSKAMTIEKGGEA